MSPLPPGIHYFKLHLPFIPWKKSFTLRTPGGGGSHPSQKMNVWSLYMRREFAQHFVPPPHHLSSFHLLIHPSYVFSFDSSFLFIFNSSFTFNIIHLILSVIINSIHSFFIFYLLIIKPIQFSTLYLFIDKFLY